MTLDFPLSEAVARCLSESAPAEVRIAAALGAIPLPAAERVVSLVALLADPEARVREAAQRGWDELPPAFLPGAVRDPRLPPPVLDRIAATAPADSPLVLRLLAHPRVGRETLERFVGSPDPRILDAIAQNQRALHRFPDVAHRLCENPALHPAERGRLEALYPRADDAEEVGAEKEVAEAAELPSHLPRALLEDQPEDPSCSPSAGEAERMNLYQLVQSLSVAEKIKLANMGSKGARKLLARDTNRVVLRAVIRSPKIREDEVLPIAQDRTTSDEILRIILERKDWLKHYPIRLALSQNPKTPTPRALRLLETLQDRDLRSISKSRNVASPVASAALRVLARRGKV